MKKIKSLVSLLLCLLIMASSVSVFAEGTVTLYTEDGRSKAFPESQVEAQLTVGWYKEPVQRLYAPDGRSKVFNRSEVNAQLNVGWYEYPVQTLYAPNKTKVFKKSDVPAQLTVGWYEYPVTQMWALDGRTKVVATAQIAAYQKVGWYLAYDYIFAKADYLRDTAGYSSATDWLYTCLDLFEKDSADYNKLKEKLDTFCLNWYAKNNWIPVGVFQSYVSTNKDGKPQANINIRNLSKKDIDSVEIHFTCYDANGNPTDDHPYVDRTLIKATYKSWLGTISSSEAVSLYLELSNNTLTKKIGNIQIKKITFEDGSTWSR